MATLTKKLWLIWLLLSAILAAFLGLGMTLESVANAPLQSQARALMLPGKSTSGHYQIELACEICHTDAFGDRTVMQDACVKCHAAELKTADDSHPKSKFTDPRNAEVAAKLEAAQCITCHVEHRPEITGPSGFTLPVDTCRICHEKVGKDRPTHRDLAFDTCTSSGCHNYHDNRALYDDFLVKHAGKPDLLDNRAVPARDFLDMVEELSDYPSDRYPVAPLSAEDVDAEAPLNTTEHILGDWLATAHAKAGANCSACHQITDDAGDAQWVERPSEQVCTQCHGPEVEGFLAGKHGMRLAQKMDPMRPADARLPMQRKAGNHELGCTSCHTAHRFDTRRAAVEACLGCHDDQHSRAYKASPHFALWQQELSGELPEGSGVSCANCHMPRVSFRTPDYVSRVLVQHNQNDTLRPNEKMIRPACLHCHSLAFSIDALADARLVATNFKGRPASHIRSIDMALEAEARAEEDRRRAAAGDGS